VTHAFRAAILLLAAGLRLWRLDQNGYDNEYYAAAVRSMAASWHAFLYNSFDPAGFVSVDKPPVALWLQAITVKLFGFHGLTVLLPQVVEGVAAVALLDYLVRRRFGTAAGLLTALFVAVTPVSVATDRSGNTESCLVAVLLAAACALLRAAEQGSRRLLLLAMALIGLGFNVKMLAAFVVLPAFALVYMLGAPLPWRRRLTDLALGGLVLVAVSLAWLVAFDLTPTGDRPFAGSSTHNSMMELAVGHNAIGRFVRLTRPPAITGDPGARPVAAAPQPPAGRWTRLFVHAAVSPLRLADGQLAGQAAWLFPLALMGVAAGALQNRWRPPLPPALSSLLLWSLWAFTYAAVYSYAGGIFHFYYLVMLAPPLAALAGIGIVTLWTQYLRTGWRTLLLPLALLATAAWQVYIEASAVGWSLPPDDWRRWLHSALVIGGIAAALGLLLMRLRRAWGPPSRAVATGFLTAGIAALLLVPGAWALSSVLVKGIAVLPSADLARLGPHERITDARASARSAWYRKLIAFLKNNHQNERYLLGTSTTRVAAPIIIETGLPVMAIGGFHGLDPILTPDKLAHLVESNEVRFVMQGDLSLIDRRMGAVDAGRAVSEWIRARGTPVDPILWREDLSTRDESGVSSAWRATGPARGLQLYDLNPRSVLLPAPPG
jgi:4-amino-4-deoxy-L-arabinose transferase-like glycosyltransferase